MKIAFDGRYLEGNLVGVGKYIQNLVLKVSQRAECFVFYSREPKNKISGVTNIVLNSNNNLYFEQILIPIALLKNKIDIYHATGNTGVPFFCPVPSVLTVHDIIPLEFKNYFSRSRFGVLSKLSYIFRLKTSLAKARKVITVSYFVRDELTNKLKVKSEKIKTIYSGPSMFLRSGKLISELVDKKYILNHGGIDIRKNLETLIKAFAIVQKTDDKIYLVITGQNKKMEFELKKLISASGLNHRIIFTGYISELDLGAVIKNAKLVCYPTLSEGFGFPIVESFGFGIPVISSKISSIPEIAGKAAILVNPKSVRQLSEAIKKVLQNKRVARNMVIKGRVEYNKYSWEKSANEYLTLYNSIK